MFKRLRARMSATNEFRREGFNCDTLRMEAYRVASSNLYS